MSFDATSFTVFGIPPYIFFSGVGAVVAFASFNILVTRLNGNLKLGNKAIVFSLPALFIGAKLFGIIANIVECIRKGSTINYKTFLFSGIVFYGGLFFFLICFIIFVHKCPPEERGKLCDAIAVSIPLFHTFGRIGCFTAGCCYGIETQSVFSVYYTTWMNGEPFSAQRVPVQIIEAMCNFCIFLLLLYFMKKGKAKNKLLKLYIMFYATLRFFDEFFRGDIDKSLFSGISAAQIISIILLIVVLLIVNKERMDRNVQSRRKS